MGGITIMIRHQRTWNMRLILIRRRLFIGLTSRLLRIEWSGQVSEQEVVDILKKKEEKDPTSHGSHVPPNIPFVYVSSFQVVIDP